MAEAGGNAADPLTGVSAGDPSRFDFFQLVRLVLLARALQHERNQSPTERGEPGTDSMPDREFLRFRSSLEMRFPGTPVVSWVESSPPHPEKPVVLEVAFMGLAGAMGVLPQHYSSLLAAERRQRKSALQDFLDIFNHRAISLFYRAWEKHRFAVTVERGRLRRDDDWTQCLFALIGLGGAALDPVRSNSSATRGQLSVSDESLLTTLGLFVHHPRHARGLQDLLRWFLDCPVEVQTLRGAWLFLAPEDQTQLKAGRTSGTGLGSGQILGARVWTGESRFVVRLGPLTIGDYERFLPEGDLHRQASELTTLYAGLEYDFVIQPVLVPEDIESVRLVPGVRLGRGTWVLSRPRHQAGDEGRFRPSGVPVIPS